MDREEARRRIRDYKEAERAAERAAMPMSVEQLRGLLETLNAQLKSCDHSLKLTRGFLASEELPEEPVVAWLGDHGGFCDCEVLANVEDVLELVSPQAPRARPVSGTKSPRTARPLATSSGWNVARLPSPWRVANLYASNEPLCLEIGKKGGCQVRVYDEPFPAGVIERESDWIRLWLTRADLPEKGQFQIRHDALGLPSGWTATLVHTPSWIPVYGWIRPADGASFFELQTELNRVAGDLPQVAMLLKHLAATRTAPGGGHGA